MKTCASCGYWDAQPLADDTTPAAQHPGLCVINPPNVFMAMGQGVGGVQPIPITFYPVTSAASRCGMHVQREPVKH